MPAVLSLLLLVAHWTIRQFAFFNHLCGHHRHPSAVPTKPAFCYLEQFALLALHACCSSAIASSAFRMYAILRPLWGAEQRSSLLVQ